MLSWTAQFLKRQLLISLPYPDADFSNQTIIVTGSNTGLGLEAARHIVRLKAAKVILAVRTISKGEKAVEDIAQTCNVPKSTLEVWQLDMSQQDSIIAFAKRAEGLHRLDAVILNAGILTENFELHAGIESHIAVNVVGQMLISSLLLPQMGRSAKKTGSRGRLTIVGSDMMYLADINELETSGKILDKLNDKSQSNISQRYQLSKVLLFYNLRELARRSRLTDDFNIILSVLTPGLCRSELFRDEASGVSKMAMAGFMAVVARTTEVGSRALVHGIEPKLLPEAHGRFLMDCKVAPNGENVESAQGQELAAKWNVELFALLEQISPGCTSL